MIENYQGSLVGVAKYFIKDQELAEEIVSDIFIYLWLRRKTLNIQTSLKAYLFKAAKNQALQHLRKNRLPTESLDSYNAQSIPTDQQPDGELQQQELEAELSADLAFLPEQQRIVFTLHRFEGFKYQEIADMLNISVNTVRNHIFQAVKKLQERYREKAPKHLRFQGK
mgnify:FL=1